MSVKIDLSCPVDNEAIKYYWDMFIADIENRDNLKRSHLYQLRILCDLCVEYDEIKELLTLQGRTYESQGRNGTQIKLHPEVQQLNKILTEIRSYSRMLGIQLVKDTKTTKEEEDNEFN
jgi:phage terminase small subunit